MKLCCIILASLILLRPAVAAPTDYTLHPGDTIKVSSLDDERFNRDLVVLPDGTINYPAVGKIHAEGMTVEEVRQNIQQVLVKQSVLNPNTIIDVSVTKTAGYTIYVVGQVKTPGVYTTSANIDVMQAITVAGGLTPFASKSSIIVLRDEGGKKRAIPFDYGDIEDGQKLDTNITLLPGDTVVVPN